MIEGRLGRRYARALFQLAREGEREEAIAQELDSFIEAYSNPSLKTALGNPAFAMESRKGIAAEVGKRLRLSVLTLHFISLLIERERLFSLPSIASHYRRLLDEAKGRVRARAAVPAPLGDGMLERLRGKLREICGKEVILKEEIDPELIGGVLIELEGRIYDGTVRTQLERMKNSFERGF